MKINNLKKRLFCAIPIFLFIILALFDLPVFEANDDTQIMKTLSGAITGKPTFEAMFCNVALGFPLYLLYSVTNIIPWYTVLFIACILISQIILYSFFYDSILINKNINFFTKLIFFLFMFFLTIWINRIFTFTTVAAFAGLSSIVYLFRYVSGNQKKQLFFSIVWLIVSFLIRDFSGFVCLAFWLCIFIFNAFKNNKKFFLKSLLVIFAVFFAISLFYFGDKMLKEHVLEPEGYVEYQKNNAKFKDFYLPDIDNPNIQNIIAKNNWTDEMFLLYRKGYFLMDSRYTINSFLAFEPVLKESRLSFKDSFNKIIFDASAYNAKGAVIFCSFALLINNLVLLIILFFNHIKNKSILKRIVLLLGVNFSAFMLQFAMFMILATIRRDPFRTIYCIVVPSFATALVCIPYIYKILNKTDKLKNKSLFIMFAILIAVIVFAYYKGYIIVYSSVFVALMLLFISNINKKNCKFFVIPTIVFSLLASVYIYNYTNGFLNDFCYDGKYRQIKEINAITMEFKNYSSANPNNIYVYDESLAGDMEPFNTNCSSKNMLFWGGTTSGSQIQKEQLNVLGLNDFNANILLKENCFYATRDSSYINLLNNLLNENEKPGEFELHEKLDYSIKIYKFIKR